MNRSPYDVLGVPASATDDQIKAAYRKLAKQYHPDLNGGSAAAETKMKEINEAYNLLIKHKGQQQPGGGYGQAGQAWSYNGQQYTYTGSANPFEEFFRRAQQGRQYTSYQGYVEMDPDLKRVEDAYIERNFPRANQILSQITTRTGAWYYWSALIELAQGNRVAALNQARIAAQLSPDQAAFASLYNQLQSGGQAYRRTGSAQGLFGGFCGNPCLSLLAINVVCSCCCRGCCY